MPSGISSNYSLVQNMVEDVLNVIYATLISRQHLIASCRNRSALPYLSGFDLNSLNVYPDVFFSILSILGASMV